MSEIIHKKAETIETEHRSRHEGYEFLRRNLIPSNYQSKCSVAVYELPPGKSNFPYHYHKKNEEVFYIIKGKGTLKTPEGNREVLPGELIYLPPNEKGAHKLTNTSESEPLVYIDFDTLHDIDVTFYPDSGKVGIWGMNINKLYKSNESVDYYDGE